MLGAVRSRFNFRDELDGDGFVKNMYGLGKTLPGVATGLLIFSVNSMEPILSKIAPCPKPSVTDLPTSYLLLCMPKHYLQHLFQWTLKDSSGVWSNSHFSAMHLNDRGEEEN